MAVKIRLRRMGANKKPFFRIVATDVRSANAGNFLEELGWYEPGKKTDNYKLDLAKAEEWIAKGAQPSETVAVLLKKSRAAAAASPVGRAPRAASSNPSRISPSPLPRIPMKELIEYVVKTLVDHPDDLRITEIEGERTIVFELRCHPDDVGKVIGKSGKTVGAIRTLLSTVAARQNRRAMLEVVE